MYYTLYGVLLMSRQGFRIVLALVLLILFNTVPVVPEIEGEIVPLEPKGTRGVIVVNASGGGDYTRIQWAIDNASEGDTVYVEAGVYYENITINKRIDLISTDSQNTVIICTYSSLRDYFVVLINTDGVKIIGFGISIKSSSRGISSIYGILLNGANNCTIENNNVTNVSKGLGWGTGIQLKYSNNNTIENNLLSVNDESIYLQYSHNNQISKNTCNNNYRNGMSFVHSNNNIISNNTCNLNEIDGISLDSSNNNIISNNSCDLNDRGGISSSYSVNNQIINNSCSHNYDGITFSNYFGHWSHSNILTKNNCSSNTNYGMMLHSNTYDNIVFHNIFENNNFGNVQAVDNGTKNIWNKGIIGNYWSDWIGPDINVDGIVDRPYEIDGSANSKDFFPMVNPNRIPIPLANAGPNITAIQHENVVFNSSMCIGQEYIVNYTWNFTYDEEIQLLFGPAPIFTFHIFEKYNVTLTVVNAWGQGTSDSIFVIIKDIVKPMARAGPDIIIDQHEAANFNASKSSDNVGIVNYTWRLFSGENEIYRFGISTGYTFNTVGKYKVTLNVSDNDGNWDTDTLNVTVCDITPPMADPGPDITINQSDTVEFFFHQHSSDNVGIINWTWIFEYNGTQVTLFHSIVMSSLPLFKFDIPGIYTVTLNVTDETGNWVIDTLNVTVLDTTSPHGNAGYGQEIPVGTIFRFNGTGSRDNVCIVNYTWTFEYDGETVTLYAVSPDFSFDIPGEYDIELVVTDADGNSASDRLSITVTPNDDDIGPIDNDDEEEDIGHSGAVWIWLSLAGLGIAVVVVLLVFFWKRKDVGDEVSGDDELGRVGNDDGDGNDAIT